MNILIITEDHSLNNFGVTAVVSQLADELAKCDYDIRVVIAATAKTSVSQNPNVQLELIPPIEWGVYWHWSPRLHKRLDEIIEQYKIDIIHLHGIWMAAQWAGLRIARRRHIPCIVSIHGMLEPWFWKNSTIWNRYKKFLYFNFVLSPNISTNAVIHAITPIEKDNLSSWFSDQKIAVIPNAISLENCSSEVTNPEKYFLFIGRLHRIKGVELLIQSFCQANLGEGWRLFIAGPEENIEYTRQLKSLLADRGFSGNIEFLGPIYGIEKWDMIKKAWALILPSYSEVVGMVNLEAALSSVPSITTYETGLVDWNDGGGMLIHPNTQELADSLIKASKWTLKERIDRGIRSRKLVEQKYSWNAVIPQWKRLYIELLSTD